MRIDLRTLRPNPFRDFTVDPIDKALVKRLQQSIEQDGFWGGIVCRKTKDGTEIAAGHHRVEAATKAGLTHADVFVSKDMDDETVVRVYARENATQRGHSAQALCGSVIGAVRLIAQELLGKSSDENSSDRLKNGIGWRQILEKLGNEGHDRGEIESAFALLKKSGDYDRVIDDVAKACGVRAPVHVVEEPHVDVRIARVFDKQSHVDTFRKKAAILTEEGTLPLNQQVPLAKELKKRAKECGRELTSAFIREEINAAVMGVKQQERTITREEKQRLEAESFQAKWTQKETNFLQALRMLLSAGLELRELSDKWPKNKAISIDSTKLLDAANRGRKELDKLITKLGG